MTRIIIAIAALALASCSTAGRERPARQVQVTNQTIASQQAGSPYVIDLTRSGTTYDVAAGIDASRVRVRTSSKEEITLAEFVRRQKGNYAGQRVLLGSLGDLVDVLPPDGGGAVSEAECKKDPRGGGTCTCAGRKDCSDLSRSGKCKSGPADAICGTGAGGGSGFGCTCDMKQ
jgi:hypothetical protein